MIETVVMHFRGPENDRRVFTSDRGSVPFHNKKHDEWIPLAISQFRKFNPDVNIYFLTTSPDIEYTSVINVDLTALDSTNEQISDLTESYVHLNTNPASFELACLCRWLDFSHFFDEYNISGPVLYVESDLLIYENISNWNKIVDNYWFTMTGGTSGSPMIINNIQAIQELANFIVSTYKDQTGLLNTMNSIYTGMQKNGNKGGISDMFFLKMFAERHSSYICDRLDDIYEDNSMFDWHIRHIENWSSRGTDIGSAIKDIQFKNGRPYCFHKEKDMDVRLRSLHFIGNTKMLIPEFVQQAELSYE